MTSTDSKPDKVAEAGETPKADSETGSSIGDGQRFGPWLRSQREGREISLREIADSSKISKRYLEALEVGKFDVLPAPVFTKGFLRQYARYVGLDPEEVLSFYESARQELEDQKEEPEELQIRRPPAGPSNLRYVLVALLIAVVMLGAVWALSRARTAAEAPSGGTEASGAGTGVEVAGGSSPSADTGSQEDPGASTASGEAGSAAAANGGEGSEVADTAGSGPEASAASAGSPDPASPGPPPIDAAATASVDAPLVVTIDFSDNCWVEAWSDGRATVSQLEVQGESLRLVAETEVRVKVGNIAAAHFEVNGMPYDPPASSGSGSVRQLTFDASTVNELRGGGG